MPDVADKAALAKRNAEALAKRKAEREEAKAAEASKPLPEGWIRVESRSRPGEFVFENTITEERQAWFPTGPATVSPEEAAKQALKAKNAAALKARKEAASAAKAAEATKPLPPGWVRGESRSRPGEVVYVNEATGERQAWFPEVSEEDLKKAELKAKNAAALAARKKASTTADASKPLPEGWRRVESRSRPGEFVYENEFTDERQAWFPDGPAEKPLPAGWRKVESRSQPGEFVYENVHTLERQAWVPVEPAPTEENQVAMPAAAQQKQAEEAKAAKANVICNAKALYDFAAGNPDEEIDLIEGDVVQVEFKAENGWWVGKNTRTNKSGIFPGTYVEEM